MYKIGVDLGGTTIKIGIVDENKNILHKKSVKTAKTFEQVVLDMKECILSLLSENNIDIKSCDFIGIACPGMVDNKNGIVPFSGNLNWKDANIVLELKKYLDLPISISNDANCAALGEVINGAAKGCENVIMFTLGTGVGGGIILDGKIFEGGFAGSCELGHTVLVVDGVQCSCGRKGCFEAYSSATALISNTKKMALKNPDSLINKLVDNNLEEVNGKTVFDALDKGDETAKLVFAEYIKYLCEGIIDYVNIFRPEKVIIGGGISNQGENLTNPIKDYIKTRCFAGERAFVPEVVIATLGNDAGIIGAAFL